MPWKQEEREDHVRFTAKGGGVEMQKKVDKERLVQLWGSRLPEMVCAPEMIAWRR